MSQKNKRRGRNTGLLWDSFSKHRISISALLYLALSVTHWQNYFHYMYQQHLKFTGEPQHSITFSGFKLPLNGQINLWLQKRYWGMLCVHLECSETILDILLCKTTSSITEWPGLEGTSRIVNLQPPCHRQGHQPPHSIQDQAAQGTGKKDKISLEVIVLQLLAGRTLGLLVANHSETPGGCSCSLFIRTA